MSYFYCNLHPMKKKILIFYLFILGEVKDGMVKIRNTSVPVFKPENFTKVPNILFYENPQVSCNRLDMT